MTDRQRQEFRRLDKVLKTFNIWKKCYRTYVSPKDTQKAYNDYFYNYSLMTNYMISIQTARA